MAPAVAAAKSRYFVSSGNGRRTASIRVGDEQNDSLGLARPPFTYWTHALGGFEFNADGLSGKAERLREAVANGAAEVFELGTFEDNGRIDVRWPEAATGG